MLKKLQLHKFKISNSSKTRPLRKYQTTFLKSAPQNYPQNALKPQSPRNSFKIVELCKRYKLRPIIFVLKKIYSRNLVYSTKAAQNLNDKIVHKLRNKANLQKRPNLTSLKILILNC